MGSKITVETLVGAPIEKVWWCWNDPEKITEWCFASADWCAPRARNELRVGGKLETRMEAKDGSAGFDFESTYTAVDEPHGLAYVMADGREVSVLFNEDGPDTRVTETFDAEEKNPLELQKDGWQAILENFKKCVEADA